MQKRIIYRYRIHTIQEVDVVRFLTFPKYYDTERWRFTKAHSLLAPNENYCCQIMGYSRRDEECNAIIHLRRRMIPCGPGIILRKNMYPQPPPPLPQRPMVVRFIAVKKYDDTVGCMNFAERYPFLQLIQDFLLNQKELSDQTRKIKAMTRAREERARLVATDWIRTALDWNFFWAADAEFVEGAGVLM